MRTRWGRRLARQVLKALAEPPGVLGAEKEAELRAIVATWAAAAGVPPPRLPRTWAEVAAWQEILDREQARRQDLA
jgi:hypothetical protein